MNKKQVLIRGEIGYLDPETNEIFLKYFDPENGELEVLHMTVPSNTELKGVRSLFDLQVGDEILVGLYENENDHLSGVLKARSLARQC